MNKKKHQGDPNDGESTDSCDENDNKTTECSHINRSVDFTKIRKTVGKSGLAKECPQCKESPSSSTFQEQNDNDMIDYEFDLSLWLCLKCGNEGCGRSHNQHALQHYHRPHSDCHALCVNTTDWRIWCYECDYVVNATCKKKLLEVFDYLKKLANNKIENSTPKQETPSMEVVLYSPTNSTGTIPKSSSSSSSTTTINSSSASISRPRGLMNLGNTCFFNSVVQCLAQTPYLLDLLKETSQPGQHFCLPGGKLNSDDRETTVLEPLEGDLECWKPLTRSLAETLNEIQNGRYEPYVPRLLLSKLTLRMPQFGGGDQHDSHELLRHLLEAVREEDLRRYQSVILAKLGLNTKTDPSTVEGDKKKIVKFYGQQASELLLPTEQVFRGVLVSTLQCQDCQHTSRRDEYFLDLSLPITERQLPPVLRRKADEIDDDNKQHPSKHQIKKEKRAERKKNKKHHHHSYNQQQQQHNVNLIGPVVNNPNGDDVNMEKSDSESDADVEDNVETNEDTMKGMESGYNSDKNSSPDSNNRGVSPDMRVDDSGVPSPAIGMLSASHGTPNNSPASSETNIDMGSPSCDQEDLNDYYDRPESRLSFVNKTVDQMDLSKLSLLPDGSDSSKAPTNDEKMDDENFEGACGGVEITKDEKMEEDNPEDDDDDDDNDLWTDTMSARYQCEDGEYSVQSCLNQFTACELMTGNNKVSCELCTKRHGGAAKKTVYTNATKQLLIYNPPAVLILHLKRFQVFRFRSAKVSKYVKFPTLLDLAPFCSKRSQTLPTFDIGQTKVLYSLYGVVEHAGSIHGGHYVAYVKVRSKLDENSYRWQFLPKNQKNIKPTVKGAVGNSDPDIPQGKWYYISDSHVSEVSEAKVLDAQAYLLFYERIL